MGTWLQFFAQLFGFGKAVADAVNKNTDSEAVKDAKFEMAKPRLTVEERLKIVRRCTVYMNLHLKDSVDGCVNFIAAELSEEDRESLRQQLYGTFPKRKHKRGFKLQIDEMVKNLK